MQILCDIIVLDQTNIWSNSVRNGHKLTNKNDQNYSSNVTTLSLIARIIKLLSHLPLGNYFADFLFALVLFFLVILKAFRISPKLLKIL